MKYSKFQEQKTQYDALIEKRITAYCHIAQTEKKLYSYDELSSSLSGYYPNSSCRDYITQPNISNEHIDYDYPIGMSFDIDYSGCSSDFGGFDIPIELIDLDDDDYDTWLFDLRNSIEENNLVIEETIQARKDIQKQAKNEKKEDNERKEYDRLRKKFGEEK